MTVLSMSRPEIDRVHVLRDVVAERITARDASQLLGVTRRQIFRLLQAYRSGGPAALLSKKRGKLSNRSYSAVVRTEALALIKANYADFGPTLAAEKLSERHGLHFGVETVRRWMLADGIWQDRRQRQRRAYQPRYRRDCVGELIQIDGSEHWWFEVFAVRACETNRGILRREDFWFIVATRSEDEA
ncbi:helix-turn-helix domain-containing protein, partial [Bradyrhizobium elkanii]